MRDDIIKYHRQILPLDLCGIEKEDRTYVEKIIIEKKDKIVMMGDIHGSFHTFLRLLYRYPMPASYQLRISRKNVFLSYFFK